MSRIKKIQPKYVKSKTNGLGYKVYPSLKIEGQWLEKAEFHPYTHVSITIEGNSLIVTPNIKKQ